MENSKVILLNNIYFKQKSWIKNIDKTQIVNISKTKKIIRILRMGRVIIL